MADNNTRKVGNLPLTKKQINVAVAAFMATKSDGSMNWDLFKQYSGLNTHRSTTGGIWSAKKEIATLLEANGFDLNEGQGSNARNEGATDGTTDAGSDDDGGTSTPKRKAAGKVKGTPRKRARVEKSPKVKKEPKMTREEREDAAFDRLMAGDFS